MFTIRQFINFFSVLITILVLLQISVVALKLGNLYYLVIFLSLIPLLSNSKKFIINKSLVWLIISCFLSILFNDIPVFFRPYERIMVFILVLCLISPLIRTEILDIFRLKLFNLLFNSIMYISALSFIAKVTGIYSGRANRVDFTGFFSHSMMLGPMAVISIIFSLYLAYSSTNLRMKKFYYFISILCFFSSIAAGSRSALIGGLGGLLFFLYKSNQDNISRYFKILFLLIGLLLISFPLWESETAFLRKKLNASEAEGDIAVTRTEHWNMRKNEFISSPFIGIGFASISIDAAHGSRFDIETGKVETGSSWLSVFSMLGILGFIPILIFFSYNLYYLFTCKYNKLQAAMLGGILIVFILHMFAEGYIFAAGSGLFFVMWTVLGLSNYFIINKNLNITK